MERKDFTDEEWKTLQFGPYWAFMAVAAQDRSLDPAEKDALVNALNASDAVQGELGREVMKSVAETQVTVFSAWQADDRSPADGLTAIRQILTKVDADEARRYKGALIWLGVSVAESSGAWLGGNVSDRERAAIQTVAEMLAYNVSDAVAATDSAEVKKALLR